MPKDLEVEWNSCPIWSASIHFLNLFAPKLDFCPDRSLSWRFMFKYTNLYTLRDKTWGSHDKMVVWGSWNCLETKNKTKRFQQIKRMQLCSILFITFFYICSVYNCLHFTVWAWLLQLHTWWYQTHHGANNQKTYKVSWNNSTSIFMFI